ncbi:hypothetical protein [Bacillus sp. AFS029533]|uniref:nucleotide-binding domain-containing protein n=1 Tax=Bacillus sp. AFS029533 TaxID=2033494 RepID=UPI001586CC5F
MAEFTTTNLHGFHCDHYVECYILKSGECVARDRIPVTIYYIMKLVIEFPLFLQLICIRFCLMR